MLQVPDSYYSFFHDMHLLPLLQDSCFSSRFCLDVHFFFQAVVMVESGCMNGRVILNVERWSDEVSVSEIVRRQAGCFLMLEVEYEIEFEIVLSRVIWKTWFRCDTSFCTVQCIGQRRRRRSMRTSVARVRSML